MKYSYTELTNIFWGLVALLFSSVMISYNFNDYSMHLDEVDLVELAESFNPFDFSTYTDDLIEFGHPPLWYAMMSGWMPLVGQTDFALRVSSILFGILTVTFVFRLGTDFSKDAFGGLASALIFGSMGFAVYLIHQTHNYALFVLSTAMLLFFYNRFQTHITSRWYGLGVVLSTLLLLYTHYYGIYPIFAINVHAAFLLQRNFNDYKRWLLLQFVSALLFVPWLPSFYKLAQAKTAALVAVPSTWDAIGGEMVVLFFHRPWIHSVVVLLGFFMLFRYSKFERSLFIRNILLLITFLFISFVSAVAVNKVIMTFFDRRMVFWLVGIALLSGFSISLIPTRIKWLVLVIVVVLSTTTPQRGVRGNWYIRQTVEFLADHVQPDDAIFYQTSIVSTEWLPRPFRYYSEQMLDDKNPFLVQNLYNLGDKGGQEYFVENIFTDFIWTRDRFWVVQTAPDNPVPEMTTLDWIERIEGRTFQLTEQYEIPLFIVSLFVVVEDVLPQLSDDGFLSDASSLPQTFDGVIQLLDYSISKTVVKSWEVIEIQSYWQALDYMDKSFAVGFHLIDDNSSILAQWDGDPIHLDRPTSTASWLPNKMVFSTNELVIDRDIVPGLYRLVVIWYDRDNLQRLPVEPFGGTEFALAEIEVQ